jgi:hypothetical protein
MKNPSTRWLVLTTTMLAYVSLTIRVMAQTPAALWSFDEGAGTVAADTSGNNRTATLNGGAGWTSSSRVGPAALNLIGGAPFAQASGAAVNTSRSFTAAAWVKLNTVSGYQTILSIDGNQVSGFYLQLNGGSGRFAFNRLASDSSSAASTVATATAAPVSGAWYHLAGVYNFPSRQISLYVNGVLQQTVSFTQGFRANGATAIGRGKFGGANGDYVDGAIDDARLYAAALSVAQIQTLAAMGNPADFTLSASPSNVIVLQGSNVTSTITVNPTGGFNGSVALSASGLPAGVTASFNPASTTTSSTLTLAANSQAAIGTSAITITGTSGSLTRTTVINLTVSAAGFYTWPAYDPNVAYDYVDEYGILAPPTGPLPDGTTGVEGIYTNQWWSFVYGTNRNSLVTSNAWVPMVERFNTDFSYIADVLRWPRDPRPRSGYYSAIYLYGSGLSTDGASNTDLGGWQSATGYRGRPWPMALLSYYPVYSFDPACPYGDRIASQGASVHEGIHCVLAGMPGCYNSAWTGEAGNTWLQGTMESQRSGDFSGMGWLSSAAAIAQFMPIECYSGWLQDGSFGGPSAEGVNRFTNNQQICTWRNLLGGTQYGECFVYCMDTILGYQSVAWAYRNCNKSGRLLQDLAEQTGGLGPQQTRRLIQEFRGRAAMCDFARKSYAYQQLMAGVWNLGIQEEWSPYWMDVPVWNATCYVATTNVGGTLYPETRTLPGWSGANQIPLTVSGSTASVTFNPQGANMSCQLVYRDTSGKVRYSYPVASGVCSIPLQNVLNNVVIAVVCNTDYVFQGEYSRTNKFNYTLTLGTGVSGTANIYTQWFNYNPATYAVTAVANGPGSISPAGTNTVAAGANISFNIAPSPGYDVLQVLAGGVPVGPVTNYTFRNVRGNVSIEAQFGLKTYRIFAKSSPVGTITPPGITTLSPGASQGYTVSANSGWAIHALKVDGVNQGPLTSYTFNNVQADHNLTASFYGNNPSVPQAGNLLFALSTDTLNTNGTIDTWEAYAPADFSGFGLQSPTVELINGAKWTQNLYSDGDGFGLLSSTNPIACNGASIVVAVKPTRNGINTSWTSIVDCFYNSLVLGLKNSNGELVVFRKGTQYNTGVTIPDGQRTVLSLVVQNTGAFTLHANGTLVYTGVNAVGGFTQIAPGVQGYMRDITVGRNGPDGWTTFNGNIGDVYVYATALSAAERQQLENVIRGKFVF